MATWTDNAYNAAPSGNDSPTLGDDGIRSTRKEVYERAKNEHYVEEHTSSAGTRTKDWQHREGSAKAYYDTYANRAGTTHPNGDALASKDHGRIYFSSDEGNMPSVYTGSAWEGFTRDTSRFSIQGTLTTGTDLVPAMIFPRACEIKKVCARIKTATSGSDLEVDINLNGTVTSSIFTSALTITAGSNFTSSETFTTANATLAADDYLTFDIDQVGSTTAGADLSVVVEVVHG